MEGCGDRMVEGELEEKDLIQNTKCTTERRDKRKIALTRILGGYFLLTSEQLANLYERNELNDFLDDPNCRILCARNNIEFGIVLEQKVTFEGEDSFVLIFYKIFPVSITPENIHKSITFSTIVDSPVAALHQCLTNIFVPTIIKNSKWSKRLDVKAHDGIIELQSNLETQIRRKQGPKVAKIEGVLTVDDEEKVWSEAFQSARDNEEADMLEPVLEIIEGINSELKICKDWTCGVDAFNGIIGYLQDLWKLGDDYYSGHRLYHLLDIIACQVTHIIQDAMKGVDIWASSFAEIEKHLNWGILMCDKANDMCRKLTTTLWPNPDEDGRLFEDGEYIPSITLKYSTRYNEILRVRSVHKQLKTLLPSSDTETLQEKKCFSCFKGINPIHYNTYTEPKWQAAIIQFEKTLAPAETAISAKLRTKLNVALNPLQLLMEFKRYKDLIVRSKVSFDLRSSREHLLIELNKMVEECSDTLISKDFNLVNGLANQMVSSMYFVRQIRSKVKDVESISSCILADLPDYGRLISNIEAVLKIIEDFETETFDDWVNSVENGVTLDDLCLHVDTPVVRFNDKNRLMEVNFNPKLRTLIEDTQQLIILGYRVPPLVGDLVNMARLYMKQAQELDQTANFHNTIGDRMIPSLRPMMLEAAVALSKMVQAQNSITWGDLEQVEDYTNKLKSLVHIIAHQNSELGHMHMQIKQKVLALFKLDLFPESNKWNDALRDIRNIFSDAEYNGYKNMKTWKIHWEHQVYKAMEVQYNKGLLEIHTKLPAIHLEIIYREHKLQFKPGLEEARTKYYANIRRLINIPSKFQGILTDASENIYRTLIQTNSHLFTGIFKDTEELFQRINEIKDRFVEWVALGSSDIEEVSKERLKIAEDWDQNFSISKAKGQEILRLPIVDEQIGCFKISFGLLRMEIELLNRKYWDILSALLQNSVMSQMVNAESILTGAITNLRIHPQTVEEITTAKKLKDDLATEIPKLKELLQDIEKKNNTLNTWTKVRLDVSRIKNMWDNFTSLLENHQIIIGHQVQNVKTSLENDITRLSGEIEHFKIRWDQLKPKDDDIRIHSEKFEQMINFIKERKVEWTNILERKRNLSDSCSKLDIEGAEFPLVDEIENDLTQYELIWLKLEEFRKGFNEFANEDWIIFRTKPYRFDEFLSTWEVKFRNEMKSTFVVQVLKEIESFKTIVPNMKYIRGDSFTEKHWYELYQMLKIPTKDLEELKLSDFLAVQENIIIHFKELKELNARAVGEITVRQALNELDSWEVEARFTLSENIDSNNQTVLIIQDFKSILSKVGDNQSLLQSIKTSPFYNYFIDRISVWEIRLSDLDEYLNSLSKIQRRWIYLEPIFSHGVLDNEQIRFRRIDEEFRSITESISIDNRVSALTKLQGIRNRLNMLLDQLSRCQNSLNEYLEKKRSGFPRFYFLGDDDLLEILGQSTKPSVIQAHLKKLFAGIYIVGFDDENEHILSMGSLEGEIVPLKSKVKITSNVEEWLSELSNEMKYTLKSFLLDCVSESKNNKKNPDKYPAQILSLCNSIVFTDRCEESIRSSRLKELINQLKDELDEYTNTIVSEQHSNPIVMELKLKDLILDVIHQIDIVECLIKEKVQSVTDWIWQKQLRFYIREDGSALVKMADAEFPYSYEYQGNSQKLVYTPLIDKCFLTLTQGMRMGLGGNPYGPAGTGKTESVKALGGFLGRQVLVFNCDEGIDVKAIGRIFIGLVKCGAWGCFDEFNRLDGATLSAISVQIQPIQTSLKLGDKEVRVMDENVPLDSNTGIFVTLNPAGKGYGGRNKLPDNLKQLFRPVVMSSPDNDLIAEVILLTEGFKHAKRIGHKLVEVYTLAGRVLTPQKHYDWGLRALKTVLKGCGNTLREFKKKENTTSEKDESDIVVSTLRLNTLPKLTYSDSFRFDHLIKDVFADVTFKDLGYDDLAQNVREACIEMKLHPNENQVRKCLELFEQLQQRMGVVIVGPPCCGKSTICQLLKKALIRMGKFMKCHIINPKSMNKSQLLGHIDLDTRQWTDGVLTLKAQQVYAEPIDVTSWIILDGDVDPEWIESLNSVLDDNRLLTLPSGWRIKFGPNVNFLFETHDLSFASPATISRMGMIFMSDEDSDVKGVVSSWLENESEETKQILPHLIENYFYKGLTWVCQQTDWVIRLSTIGIVKNALSQMHGVKTISHLAVSMIHGLSGHLGYDARIQFAKQVISWTQQSVQVDTKDFLNLYYDSNTDRIAIYEDSNLSDYTIEIHTSHLPLVKTANVRQILSQIHAWLQVPQPFILVGPEGCGKTMILDHAFEKLKSTEVATIHCSSLISPQQVLQKLSQVCITNTTINGRVYKPKSGERLILYFKDINLVKPDKWGTCQLVQLLHQIVTYDGFYDNSLEWVGLQGVQIVASITVGNTAGRYLLSPRFTSITRLYAVSEPQKDQLTTIYKSYLTLYMKTKHPNNPVTSSTSQINGIALAIVTFYESIKAAFSPVQQSHYQFTPRDLTNWVSGIMRYDLEVVEKNAFEDIVQVWASEACRLFRDKLVSDDDKAIFDSILETTLRNEWSITDMKARLAGSHFLSGFARAAATSNSIPPPKGMNPDCTLAKIQSEQLTEIVERGISQFSREYRDLNIVIFPEVLDNVAHFDRILSAPYASMVLAGRSGVGRRTAISVVSSLHGATLFTLKVGRNYSIKQFKNDLKTAIQMSAIDGTKVFFMVEDFQLIEDVFLDMLNSLLSSGEVPGLYTPDELETMISPLREIASAEGYNSTLTSFFAQRVKKLMHLILIMDYTNTDFRRKCESNPAIYKQCSLLWLDIWSCSTLQLLPKLIIYKFYRKEDGTAVSNLKYPSEVEDDVFMKGFQLIYGSLEPQLASPRRFIAFIHTYATLENKRRELIFERTAKLNAGVSKLEDARNVVEKLKAEAASQEIILAEKQAEANNALEQITNTMRNANVQRGEMEELREKTLRENEILLTKKKAIDEELKEIEPLVQQAMSSVGNIKNESLSEIRSLRAPPDTIRDILEGVLRLMGIMDMSWNSMKNFLAQRGVKDEIRNFDARTIKKEDRNAVDKLLKERVDSFDQKNAKRASAAAAPLATWVVANVKYSRVLEKISPLESQQILLEKNLKMAEGQIGLLSSELLDVDQRVNELKGQLNQYTKEAAQIEIRLNNAKTTLLAAEGLVGKLLDEFSRWNEQLGELELELKELSMKTRFAAAFMTYLSDATEDTRAKYLQIWLELFPAQQFDFCQFMSDEQERLTFQKNGLPSDRLSYENAIIINQTTLRPYLIDPSSRATEWLKSTMGKRSIVTISLRDPKFSTELELAVRFGKVFIIYEADEIEPILIPILRGDIICQGSRDLIQIADKFVDYNADFRIFLCTRNPNPILPPDTASLVTIINFTTTRAGLTTQLLAKTLSIEKPELETQKTSLLKQTDTLKEQLARLGEILLQELAHAQGNILTNEDLLSSLDETKTKSLAIRAALAETTLVEEELNKEINVYLPLAEFGSNLYFAIIDVTKLNNIYRFSLFSFMSLFKVNLTNKNNANSMESRMIYLQNELERSVYEFVCRSLFKTDRLAFALHIVHTMHPTHFEKDEWEGFTGQLVVDLKADSIGNTKETIPSWISEDRSFAVMLLRVAFPSLFEKLDLMNMEAWSEFFHNTDCEDHIPAFVKSSLSQFQILMIVQTLRPDRLHSVMTSFARRALGRKSLFPPPNNLRDVYKIMTSFEPILILTSPGADPSQELRELAESTVGSERYSEIPMGQGMNEAVIAKLKEAADEGTWVCLTNLHLVTHWLDYLDKELHDLEVHEDFRLWLTTEPHELFPPLLAHNCLKIAYEAPEGLKKNLQRTYSNWSENFIVGNKNIIRSQSLFALAFFHAIVQERRTYIPQGWSKFYEYNESDLRAGVDVLESMFNASRTKEIQWQYVQGIFENAIYGGRVENIYDNRVLVTYLHDYFNESLVSGAQSSRKLLGAGIKMPTSSNYQDYLAAIESIPESDKPSYFGLPSNIERSWQRTVSGQVIAQLKTLSLVFSSDVIYDQSIWNKELNPILNIWKKINHTHGTASLLQAKLKPPAVQNNPIDPIEAFMGLEYHNTVCFIQTIHRSLGIISKVLRGTLVPTLETITLANSLLRRETPEDWLKTWEGPKEAPEFLQGIVQRVASIQFWVSQMESGTLLSEPLNLSDLFNPESFLSAFKQQCARNLKISMDELGFVCAWNKSSIPANRLTCKLTGLLLEGCSFNGMKLVENTTESSPIFKVPDCTIAWVPQQEVEARRAGEVISVPLYYNETRQKLIGSLDFPSYGENVKWIQAGVGLFLST